MVTAASHAVQRDAGPSGKFKLIGMRPPAGAASVQTIGRAASEAGAGERPAHPA